MRVEPENFGAGSIHVYYMYMVLCTHVENTYMCTHLESFAPFVFNKS
jgi:hypothetical protein